VNFFYRIALLGSPLDLLTYHSETILKIGTEVEVTLSNRALKGVVIAECEKPDFVTQPIHFCHCGLDPQSEILNQVQNDGKVARKNIANIYSDTQIKTAHFISEYYGCSLGEALNLFVPYQRHCGLRVPFRVDLQSEILNQVQDDNVCYSRVAVNITLSSTQSQALDFIRSHNVSLLFGDTGAGKERNLYAADG
jgi:primosomal protein N' (replication factor Y) (superfamily II helicase)